MCLIAIQNTGVHWRRPIEWTAAERNTIDR
jgi:hypothetical protein